MTPPPVPALLPNHWTPDQALAVFEMIDLMRDQIWLAYGTAIQSAMRNDCTSTNQNPTDTDPPF